MNKNKHRTIFIGIISVCLFFQSFLFSLFSVAEATNLEGRQAVSGPVEVAVENPRANSPIPPMMNPPQTIPTQGEHEEIRDGMKAGEVRLSKTATPVQGMVNQWDIKLKIEGRNSFPPPKTDVMMVIDTSGSMNQDGRMGKAKDAASKFLEQLLKKGYENRVGFVAFSDGKGREVSLTDDRDYLNVEIHGGFHGIWPVIPLFPWGATHTQEGVRRGMEILEEQGRPDARKVLVLISDGVPTRSYKPKDYWKTSSGTVPSKVFQGYNETFPSPTINNGVLDSGFIYPSFLGGKRIGDGKSMLLTYDSYNKYNHGNHAVAETNYWKIKNRADGLPIVDDVYTIAVDMSPDIDEKLLGTVFVRYEDMNGKALYPEAVLTGEIGVDYYTTKQRAISGHTFQSVSGQTSGVFTEEIIHVVYKYRVFTPNTRTVPQLTEESSETLDTEEAPSDLETSESDYLGNLPNEPLHSTDNRDNVMEPTTKRSIDLNIQNIAETSATRALPSRNKLDELRGNRQATHNGTEVLRQIATNRDMCYSVSGDGLVKALESIGIEILAAVKEGQVTDPLGEGFEFAGTVIDKDIKVTQGNAAMDNLNRKLTWDIGTLLKPVSGDPYEDIMYAEMTYRINANISVLNQGVIGNDGLAATNGRTVLNFIDTKNQAIQKEFVLPRVDPTIVRLQKKVEGKNANSSAVLSDKFSVGMDEGIYGGIRYRKLSPKLSEQDVATIVHPWVAGKNHGVEEFLRNDQVYDVSIGINGNITAGKSRYLTFNEKNYPYADREITVINTEPKPKEKKLYLHIRQCVLKTNGSLVVPKKAFYGAQALENSNIDSLNFISGSTTNDSPLNVNSSLFTKYRLPYTDSNFNFRIKANIPEYYEQVGVIVTKNATDIRSKHISTNLADFVQTKETTVIDYSDTEENWMTIFITPKIGPYDSGKDKENSTRPYSWDYKTNVFGR